MSNDLQIISFKRLMWNWNICVCQKHIVVECQACPDPESFVRGVRIWRVFLLLFLVDEGREGPNTTISRPSSARQQNAI